MGLTPEEREPSSFSAEWQGPLPPPSLLAAYENIVPGAAKLIIEMAKAAQDHQIRQEERILDIQDRAIRMNEWTRRFSTIIGAFIPLAGAYAIIQGATIGGSVIAGGGLLVWSVALLRSWFRRDDSPSE